jgi:hypothetical protein
MQNYYSFQHQSCSFRQASPLRTIRWNFLSHPVKTRSTSEIHPVLDGSSGRGNGESGSECALSNQ